jgi:uncharacterized protein YneF (UPF0154 family)
MNWMVVVLVVMAMAIGVLAGVVAVFWRRTTPKEFT